MTRTSHGGMIIKARFHSLPLLIGVAIKNNYKHMNRLLSSEETCFRIGRNASNHQTPLSLSFVTFDLDQIFGT
ncbi:MAG TPA: hypothetical protein VK957_09325 [Lunatimonas sp.]|nr:hypothetical protein [Lunatimonas sp.]